MYLNLVNPQQRVKKFEIGPKNFDCNNKGKNEMEDFNHKIWSRFSDTVSHVIDFMACGLHWDHPPVCELIETSGGK